MSNKPRVLVTMIIQDYILALETRQFSSVKYHIASRETIVNGKSLCDREIVGIPAESIEVDAYDVCDHCKSLTPVTSSKLFVYQDPKEDEEVVS